jgi:hypothetical protein
MRGLGALFPPGDVDLLLYVRVKLRGGLFELRTQVFGLLREITVLL